MAKKIYSVSLDPDVYSSFQEKCKNGGFSASSEIELFMKRYLSGETVFFKNMDKIKDSLDNINAMLEGLD